MDLGPPTVIRLERALAHWSSRYGSETSTDQGRSCRISRGHTPDGLPASSRRSRDMAQPVNGKGDRCAGQTEPDPNSSARAAARARRRACQPVLRAPGRVVAVEHRDFHNVPVPGDLGCGKIMSAGRTARLAGITERGNRGSARTQLVDDPVDNELRSMIAASGKTRGERIVERRGSGGSVGTST
jgi:hypothetical protein